MPEPRPGSREVVEMLDGHAGVVVSSELVVPGEESRPPDGDPRHQHWLDGQPLGDGLDIVHDDTPRLLTRAKPVELMLPKHPAPGPT
jgi:hypothetical protein